jgi:diguanylate cyclase (GGDEF)-like protein
MSQPKKIISLVSKKIFEGSYIEKSQCIFLFISLVTACFSILLGVILAFTDSNTLTINRNGYEGLLQASSLSSVYCLIMYLVGRYLSPKEHRWYAHACIYSYVFINCVILFFIGPYSLATGIALAGAPLIGLIIFDKRLIYSSLSIGLIVLIVSTVLFQHNALPYAPIRTNQITQYQDPLWLFTVMSFVFAHLALLVFIASVSISRWRIREAEATFLSTTDPLTGIPNRRHLMTQFKKEYARALRSKQPISIFLVDLDFFKQVNDEHGHLLGDEALKSAASILKESLREVDLVGRYGGEEFLAILPNTDVESAHMVAERFRENLANHVIPLGPSQNLTITASIGLNCQIPSNTDALDHFLAEADKALYRAKSKGRNKVIQVDPEPALE